VRPGIVGKLIDAVRWYDRLPACRCARSLKLPFRRTPAGWQPAVPTIRERTGPDSFAALRLARKTQTPRFWQMVLLHL